MSNQRRNLAIQIQTPGGDNPLLVSLVSAGPYYRGVAVSGLALVGKGGTAPYAYSIIATSSNDLPPGLSVDPLSGQITGTPSLAGHFSFIAQVSDSASATFTHSFSITILAQLFWRGPPPPKGEISVSYNYQFRVFDAAGTLLTSGFTYDGTLPAGLTLSTGGLLSGTPTAPAGISYATVHATDGTDTLDIPISIEIAEAVNGYYLEDRDPPDGWGGGSGSWLPSIVRLVDWSAHLVITGGVGPYSVVDSETDPPPTGITINNSRSRILGGRTADAASTEAKLISVIITDALGATKAIQRATLIIDSQQPRITPRKNGSELSGGNGFTNFDLVEGDGVSIEATNDGATVQYRVSASGGAGGGIATIAGVGPDSSGNLEIEGIEQDSSGQLHVIGSGDGGSIFTVPIQSDVQSTQYGSSTKLTVGRRYFDPSAPEFGLKSISTAVLYMLLEVTNGSNSACGELLQETGTGSPAVIGTITPTNGTTAALCSADVSAAFTDTSPAGIFAARIWLTSPNGNDEATCSAAWIEVTP